MYHSRCKISFSSNHTTFDRGSSAFEPVPTALVGGVLEMAANEQRGKIYEYDRAWSDDLDIESVSLFAKGSCRCQMESTRLR